VNKRARLRHTTRDGEHRGPRLEDTTLGGDGGTDAIPYVALKYYEPAFQCFSEWTPDELRAFSDFNRKLRNLTWPLIYRSGGRPGTKTGLGYTALGSSPLRRPLSKPISDDISWFELRVTQRARVHGFRAGPAFCLVYLDRAHELFPS